jgi:hypothetical protein
VTVAVGGKLPPAYDPSTRTLALAREVGFAFGVKGVRAQGGELVLVLRTGSEVRFGVPSDVALKLTIADAVLRRVGLEHPYVDVSVPERPVVG